MTPEQKLSYYMLLDAAKNIHAGNKYAEGSLRFLRQDSGMWLEVLGADKTRFQRCLEEKAMNPREIRDRSNKITKGNK